MGPGLEAPAVAEPTVRPEETWRAPGLVASLQDPAQGRSGAADVLINILHTQTNVNCTSDFLHSAMASKVS